MKDDELTLGERLLLKSMTERGVEVKVGPNATEFFRCDSFRGCDKVARSLLAKGLLEATVDATGFTKLKAKKEMGNILIDKKGRVWVYNKEGTEKRLAAPGWEQGWLFENVYGWLWHGPTRGYGGYSDLIVLGYEPDREERLAIQERFKNEPTPEGEPLFTDPWLSQPQERK